MQRLLIVDDDIELCALMDEYLAPEAFVIEAAHDGQTGLERAVQGDYAMLILDVMLPRLGGFELLRQLRARGVDTPVLMLTARGEAIDRVVGLELGADDYLPKPFNPRELAARLKAVMRRARCENKSRTGEVVAVGDVELNVSTRTAKRRGQTCELTSAEFDLLAMLMKQAGTIVSREAIAQEVFQRRLLRLDRTVDMHVSNLRKKLGTNAGGQERIVTVRGAGYLYALLEE